MKKTIVLLVALSLLGAGCLGSSSEIKSAKKGGEWAYSSGNEESGVDLLPTEDQEEPTVRYRYGDTALTMTLLQGPEGPAQIIESDLKDGVLKLKGAIPGHTVEYRKLENGLKENIVILRREAADAFPDAPAYAFALLLENAIPARDEQGNIQPRFNNAETGEYAFHIPEPNMVDAAGVESFDIEVRIRKTAPGDSWFDTSADPNSQWLLIMRPSLDWLLEEAREYPVRVDPSIVTEPDLR